jgi:hypothetical protein
LAKRVTVGFKNKNKKQEQATGDKLHKRQAINKQQASLSWFGFGAVARAPATQGRLDAISSFSTEIPTANGHFCYCCR